LDGPSCSFSCLPSFATFQLVRVLYTKRGQEWLASNKEAWKTRVEAVDYLWLFLSIAGLLAIGWDIDRTTASTFVSGLIEYSAFNNYSEYIQGNIDYYSAPPADPAAVSWFTDALAVSHEGSRLLGEAKALIRNNVTSGEVVRALDSAIEAYSRFIFTHSNVDISKRGGSDAQYVLDRFLDTRVYAEELRDNYAQSLTGEFEWLMDYVSPFLLGAGLAIRFAKVTAKVFVPV
jgi:hypothetical protein